MRGDAFERAARVIHRSAPVRAVHAVDDAVRIAWTRSRIVAAGARGRRAAAAVPAAERVRLAGIVLLTAASVHDGLRPLTSLAVRSTAPHAAAFPAIVLAIV